MDEKKLSKNFYCGNKEEIPDKYDRRGTQYECLRRGVGVGKMLAQTAKIELTDAEFQQLALKYGINNTQNFGNVITKLEIFCKGKECFNKAPVQFPPP